MPSPAQLLDFSILPRHLSQAVRNLISNGGLVIQGTSVVSPVGGSPGLDGKSWRLVQISLTFGADTFNLLILEEANTNVNHGFVNAWMPVRGWDLYDTTGAVTPNAGYEYSFRPSATGSHVDTVNVEGNPYYIARLRFERSFVGGPGGNTVDFGVEIWDGTNWNSNLQIGDAQLSSGASGNHVIYNSTSKRWEVDTNIYPSVIRADANKTNATIAATGVLTIISQATVPAGFLADGDQLQGRLWFEVTIADPAVNGTFNWFLTWNGAPVNNEAFTYAAPFVGTDQFTLDLIWTAFRQGNNLQVMIHRACQGLPGNLLSANPLVQLFTGVTATNFALSRTMEFQIQFNAASAINIATFRDSHWKYFTSV